MMKSQAIDNKQSLVVIVGPTASGKSALGLELARLKNGEIICADSRTVYRGMDIGTAKPSRAEQTEIRHWCLDLVNPNQVFSVGDFQREAKKAIANIRSRGKLPILVGGSGLYVDSIIFDFVLRPKSNEQLRRKLEALTIEELQEYCKKYNYRLPENKVNKRHLIRTIETKGDVVKNNQILPNTVIIGIDVEKTALRQRIRLRIEQMLEQGLIKEVMSLYKNYNNHFESMTANIYSLVKDYLDGKIQRDELIELATARDMRLVKKQHTWFKRNSHIVWLQREEALGYILSKLD